MSSTLFRVNPHSIVVWMSRNSLVKAGAKYEALVTPVQPNVWVFLYELNGSGFESSCSHLTFRFRACFEQGFPWHSGNYRVWIHSETHTWHDKNTQLTILCLESCYSFQKSSTVEQAWAYERQGHMTIARLSSKFRGCRCVKLHATHQVGVWWATMIIPFRTP